MFCKIGFFKNFAKFTEIHLCRSLFFNKAASELLQNFMRNVFIEHLGTTASENERLSFKIDSFFLKSCAFAFEKIVVFLIRQANFL